MKGKFIAFEGCEGAGKSTQMRLLSEYLAKKRVAHAVTREPGGGEISEAIRKVILNGKFTSMTDECEALLYAAARVQHLADTVEPALNEVCLPGLRARIGYGVFGEHQQLRRA